MFPDLKTKLSFLILCLYFIGILFFLILSFKNWNSDIENIYVFFLVVSALVGCLIFFSAMFLRYLTMKKIERRHYQESLLEGAIEEAGIHRDLTKDEQNILLKFFHRTGKNDFYLDSRSPVFKIQGNSFKQILLNLLVKTQNIPSLK